MKNISRVIILVFTLICLCPLVLAEDSVNITDKCQIKVSEGSASNILDGNIASAWSPAKDGAQMSVKLPDSGAGFIRIEWMFDNGSFTLEQYNADKEVIDTLTSDDTFPAISHTFALNPSAKYVILKLTSAGQEICSARVYSIGELPNDVQMWEAPYDKCDLLVVSTHQDDEFIFFGGIIPYYEYVKDKNVQVMYMANCGRLRRGEALSGLWTAGVKNYPEFINLKDKRVDTIKSGVALWDGKDSILKELVSRIRKYKPEVILTHDLNGEYGHNQHKITAMAMQYAIEAAADETQFTDSYDLYGAWQVKKLYLHLFDKNIIDFDWNIKYEELNNFTPLEVAKKAYSKHKSQQDYYQVNDGGQYDNSKFGLSYTFIGDDIVHDDLFENINSVSAIDDAPIVDTSLAPSIDPLISTTIEPSTIPSIEPSVEPAAEPTLMPTAEPAIIPTTSAIINTIKTETGGNSGKPFLFIGGVIIGGGALLGGVIFAQKIVEKRSGTMKRSRRRR